MKKLFFLSIFLIAILFAVNVNGQFSRQEAINLVLNDVLSDDVGKINVFSSLNSVTTSIDLIDNYNVSNPYAESWIFFSDDSPFASWYHSSRIIFVNAQNGDHSISNVEIFPKGLNSEYEEISSPDLPDPIVMDSTSFVPDPEDEESNYNYALIVVSIDEERNWYNASLVYNVLLQNYNYKKDNIFVLYSWDGNSGFYPYYNDLDGDGNFDDIDGPATWENIINVINDLSGEEDNFEDVPELQHSDQLAVFFTGVPVHSAGPTVYMSFPVDEYSIDSYIVSSVSQPIEDIDCAQMIFFFDINSSSDVSYFFEAANGTDVKCQNRLLYGPTASGEVSHVEMYISNGAGHYSEQLFYWASAARGYLAATYSPWNHSPYPLGTYPYYSVNGMEDHPADYPPDDNDDGFIQMCEAFQYANDQNTWSDDEYYYNPYIPGESEIPFQTDEIPFEEYLLTFSGLTGLIEISEQTIDYGNFLFCGELKINENVELTFTEGSKFYFIIDNAWLNIVQSATLFVEDNIYFYGESDNNKIEVYGILDLGQNVHFNKNITGIDDYFEIYLENSSNTFDKSIFEHCLLENHGSDLLLTDTEFFYSILSSEHGGDITVSSYSYSEFDHTIFKISNGNNEDKVIITDGIFSHNIPVLPNIPAIDINNYKYFEIANNNINGYSKGIYLQYSGDGIFGNQNIYNNEIYDNSNCGIIISNSTVSIYNNEIYDNEGKGIILTNRSNVSLFGDPGTGEQIIMNNEMSEVYASGESFPYNFRNNQIKDVVNQSNHHPLVYHEWEYEDHRDVRYNYWGHNFNPLEDFYPVDGYNYLPIWYPGLKNTLSPTEGEILFNEANLQFETENFIDANTLYQALISQYSGSIYARAAMKELFRLEQFAGNDYNSLKDYYQTNEIILADTALMDLGEFLANKCNVKLENWQEAIDHYEFVIMNTEYAQDSIFAIVDLGNLYFLMENSGAKSGFTCKMPEYRFETMEEYEKKRDYLLSLLPFKRSSQLPGNNTEDLETGTLSQNIPNPCSDLTNIYYNLEEAASVSIRVFNRLGMQQKLIEIPYSEAGINKLELNTTDLPAGIYFYSLIINEKVSDTKKFVIVR